MIDLELIADRNRMHFIGRCDGSLYAVRADGFALSVAAKFFGLGSVAHVMANEAGALCPFFWVWVADRERYEPWSQSRGVEVPYLQLARVARD